MSPSRSGVRKHCTISRLGLAAGAALPGCTWGSGFPDPASSDASLVALLAAWMFALGFLVLFVTLGLLLVGIGLQWRGEKRLSPGWARSLVLGGGVVAPLLAVAAISASGMIISSRTEGQTAMPGQTIRVVGERWWWRFQYLDGNGEIIATTANELHLPVGRRSRLHLISENVIHSFWAPNLQGKTDLVPGSVNTLAVEPDVAGTFRGQCAELCGVQHAMMGFLVIAQPPAAFDAWLARQSEPAQAAEGDGPDVFFEYGCAGCHTVRGMDATGVQGPDLTHLASRRTIAAARLENTRDNLRRWITAGQSAKPGNLMPEFSLPEDDLAALLDLLEALE